MAPSSGIRLPPASLPGMLQIGTPLLPKIIRMPLNECVSPPMTPRALQGHILPLSVPLLQHSVLSDPRLPLSGVLKARHPSSQHPVASAPAVETARS